MLRNIDKSLLKSQLKNEGQKKMYDIFILTNDLPARPLTSAHSPEGLTQTTLELPRDLVAWAIGLVPGIGFLPPKFVSSGTSSRGLLRPLGTGPIGHTVGGEH